MCIEVDCFDLEEMNNGNQPIEKLDEPKSQLTVFDISNYVGVKLMW